MPNPHETTERPADFATDLWALEKAIGWTERMIVLVSPNDAKQYQAESDALKRIRAKILGLPAERRRAQKIVSECAQQLFNLSRTT